MWRSDHQENPIQSSISSRQLQRSVSIPQGSQSGIQGYSTHNEPLNSFPPQAIEASPAFLQPAQASIESTTSQSSNILSMRYPHQHSGQHTADSFSIQHQYPNNHHQQYHNIPSQNAENESLIAPASFITPPYRIPSDRDTTYPTSSSTTDTLDQQRGHSSTDLSPLIARVSIPKSHHTQFVDALASPPDPTLKIKKSVQFNNSSFDTTASTSKSARRERNTSDEYPITKSTAAHSLGLSSYSTNNIKSQYPPLIDKDPEEKMAELMELKRMKIRQEDFLHMKDQIFQITQTLEDKQSILDEVRSERKTLQSELSRYITMVKQIQKDFELAQQAETELTKERDQLSQHLTQLKHHDFKNIKEEVDQLREKKGLRPLPSLEQEEAEYMGRYLEQRREQWREDGMQDVTLPNGSSYDNGTGGSNDNSNDRRGSWPSSSSTAAAGPPSSSSNRASGSKTLRNSASSSSLVSASSPTAASSGRDGGRSGRSRHSNPGHSRSNNSSGKSKHESSSRSGSGGHASSRSARLNQSRSQSPSQSSTSANARAERMKKRSRY